MIEKTLMANEKNLINFLSLDKELNRLRKDFDELRLYQKIPFSENSIIFFRGIDKRLHNVEKQVCIILAQEIKNIITRIEQLEGRKQNIEKK